MKVADKYLAVRRSISDIFELNHRCYGYRREGHAAVDETREFVVSKPKRLLRWNKVGGRMLAGLAKRRISERRLFLVSSP